MAVRKMFYFSEELFRKAELLAECASSRQFRDLVYSVVSRLEGALATAWSFNKDEPKIVEDFSRELESSFQKLSETFACAWRNSNRIQYDVEAKFIHGAKSMVSFSYYGKEEITKELADVLYIFRIIDETGSILLEKATFNQVKKMQKQKGRRSNNIPPSLVDKGQLYLLSRFPPFKFVEQSGISHPTQVHFMNNYKRLGSYSILFEAQTKTKTGKKTAMDIGLLSAFLLARELSPNTLSPYSSLESPSQIVCHPLLCRKCVEMVYYFRRYHHKYGCLFETEYMPFIMFADQAANALEFVEFLLLGWIGEPLVVDNSSLDHEALSFVRFLERQAGFHVEGDLPVENNNFPEFSGVLVVRTQLRFLRG